MSANPLIAITCSMHEENTQGVFDYNKIKRAYAKRIYQAGGFPFIIPTLNFSDERKARTLLKKVDALLLSGGDDIDPVHFNETNDFPSSTIHPERDAHELMLARCAFDIGLPLYGICRGMQVINVAFGGTIWQDTTLRPDTTPHKSKQTLTLDYLFHEIDIEPDSKLFQMAGKAQVVVNSGHHQHIKKLAKGFSQSATAHDGVIEAMEWHRDEREILGVQWHPESMHDDELSGRFFQRIVDCARNQQEHD